MASDLGLHCLPVTLLRVPGKNGLKTVMLSTSMWARSATSLSILHRGSYMSGHFI